jgi:DNA-binding Xre family transcriptional regulator
MIQVRLKEAAQARGIENSKQLADRMDCAPTIIWKIWTGKFDPKLPMLDRLCEALDCDLSELIVRKPNHRQRSASPQKRNGARQNSVRPNGAKSAKPKRAR